MYTKHRGGNNGKSVWLGCGCCCLHVSVAEVSANCVTEVEFRVTPNAGG